MRYLKNGFKYLCPFYLLFFVIFRIENLDKWCRDLRILYLQSNLIPKIGNTMAPWVYETYIHNHVTVLLGS